MHSKHLSLFGGKMRGSLYELNFLLNLAIAVVSFYLGVFADSVGVTGLYVGLIFSFGSAVSIFALSKLSEVSDYLGIKKMLLLSATMYGISLYALSYGNSILTIGLPYVFMSIGLVYAVCALDIYVSENTEHDHNTSKVRGIFLAVSNISYILGPFIGGLLIQIGDFRALYIAAALFIIPFVGIVFERLPNIKELSHHHAHSLKKSLIKIWNTKQLREVFIAQSIYRKFGATFNTFAGLYLTHVAKLSFLELGIVFTCMIIPYVIVEIPLGKVLDKNWSERTPAMIGFFIMAFAVTAIPSSEMHYVPFWCILFFVLGIGGGLVELSIESYFFKHVKASSEEEVAAFRSLYPLAYLFGPITGGFLLYIGSYALLFPILALTLIYGAKVAYTLE